MSKEVTIEGLVIYDFECPVLFDSDGYTCDAKLDTFEDKGKGIYEMTVTNLGRSDKTIKND